MGRRTHNQRAPSLMTDNTTAIDIRRDAEAAAATFPALLVEAERIAQTVAAGLHGRRRAGPGETFWQHRPYSFGDPVSAIDWRQSARVASRLFVRENEWEAAAAVFLWRDPSASLNFASLRNVPLKRRRADILAVAPFHPPQPGRRAHRPSRPRPSPVSRSRRAGAHS